MSVGYRIYNTCKYGSSLLIKKSLITSSITLARLTNLGLSYSLHVGHTCPVEFGDRGGCFGNARHARSHYYMAGELSEIGLRVSKRHSMCIWLVSY